MPGSHSGDAGRPVSSTSLPGPQAAQILLPGETEKGSRPANAKSYCGSAHPHGCVKTQKCPPQRANLAAGLKRGWKPRAGWWGTSVPRHGAGRAVVPSAPVGPGATSGGDGSVPCRDGGCSQTAANICQRSLKQALREGVFNRVQTVTQQSRYF